MDLIPVRVWKRPHPDARAGDQEMMELPGAVRERLGDDYEEYPGFVITYLPPAEVEAFREVTRSEGLPSSDQLSTRRYLPSGASLDRRDLGTRNQRWHGPISSTPVESNFLVYFRFPILESWLDDLAGCGVRVLQRLGRAGVLARASSSEDILQCGSAARRLEAIDQMYTTDRAEPGILTMGFQGRVLEVHLEEGSQLSSWAGSHLPPGLIVAGLSPGSPVILARVESVSGFLSLLSSADPALLRLSSLAEENEEGPAVILAGERQAQVTAGNWDPTLTPGYQSFLTSRFLWGSGTATNLPRVAVFDTGISSLNPPLSGALPGAGFGQRVVAATNITDLSSASPETIGINDYGAHGTLVAGVLSAYWNDGSTSDDEDVDGFLRAMGISPYTRLVDVKMFGQEYVDIPPDPPQCIKVSPCDTDDPDLCGVQPSGGPFDEDQREQIWFDQMVKGLAFAADNGSTISNNSWNIPFYSGNYRILAKNLDEATRDINPTPDPTIEGRNLFVFAAGNSGGKIYRPALAKNVLTVGSVDLLNPDYSGEAPQGPKPRLLFGECLALPPSSDYHSVSTFSPRGDKFGSLGNFSRQLETIRVKPDLVAPGHFVSSSVPQPSEFTCHGAVNSGGCLMYSPSGQDVVSVAAGTSFAAPAVSAAASIATKVLVEGDPPGDPPRPSLVKAALIATAESLGDSACPILDSGKPADCRPSYHYGWGRLSIDRITSGTPWVASNEEFSVGTGEVVVVAGGLQPVNPNEDVLIALVWSDAPNTQNNPHVPSDPEYIQYQGIQNDLGLSASSFNDGFWLAYWWGNYLNENVLGIDDGYSAHCEYWPGPPPGGENQCLPFNDTANNVEVIFIPSDELSAVQSLVLSVTGESVVLAPRGLPQTGTQRQDFSVFAWNLQ